MKEKPSSCRSFLFLAAISILLFSFNAYAQTNEAEGRSSLSEAYDKAIGYAESGSYEKLAEIISNTHDLPNHSVFEGCTLLCEFISMNTKTDPIDPTPEVDERALTILLQNGANPNLAEGVFFELLAMADDDFRNYSDTSGACNPRRESLLPIMNLMIVNGVDLKDTSYLPYSAGYYYVFGLCHSPNFCGSPAEVPQSEVVRRVSAALTSEEFRRLSDLTETKLLTEKCVAQFWGF